ncbi:MAG: hypothetical protein IT374_07675 [Polyangiaceae bacterium]|nr:hypothetical protein [Polyangiaceae bacterium]
MKLLPLSPLLALSLVCLGCRDRASEPSRWDKKVEEVKQAGGAATSSQAATAGSALNRYFPPDGAAGKRVFTQEKSGYAEAKLQRDGKDTATLSIADLSTNPDAKKKYEGAPDEVAGFPLTTLGTTTSSVLVKGRYQVRVSSPSLDAAARKEMLGRFDLAGLARL